MQSAANAHFWQVDHYVKQIAKVNQAVVLPSPEAWEKYSWSRKYFESQPTEGYFVWIREDPRCPLFTCINLIGKNVKQKLSNLVVIEQGLKIDLSGFCGSLNLATHGAHEASGRIVLKKGVNLKYKHVHAWKGKDTVSPNYEFILEEGVKFDYTYQLKIAPKLMNMQTTFICGKNASVQFQVLADCENTDLTIRDNLMLAGADAKGISKLRFVVREHSTVKAISRLTATSPAVGHIDCQSLMIDKTSRVKLIPEIDCQNKEAALTHEASVGKISEEQINYLRMRGLNLDQALNLIITGFLKMQLVRNV